MRALTSSPVLAMTDAGCCVLPSCLTAGTGVLLLTVTLLCNNGAFALLDTGVVLGTSTSFGVSLELSSLTVFGVLLTFGASVRLAASTEFDASIAA